MKYQIYLIRTVVAIFQHGFPAVTIQVTVTIQGTVTITICVSLWLKFEHVFSTDFVSSVKRVHR